VAVSATSAGLAVPSAPATLSVEVNPSPIRAGTYATLAATVTAPGLPAQQVTGTVHLRVAGSTLAGEVVAGRASVTVRGVDVGTHPVDADFVSSTRLVGHASAHGTASLAVTAAASQVTLQLSAASARVGDPVAATVTVRGPAGLGAVDDGVATVSVAGTSVSGPVRAGVANLVLPSLGIGVYRVGASYTGGANLGVAQAREAALEVRAVESPAPSSPAPPPGAVPAPETPVPGGIAGPKDGGTGQAAAVVRVAVAQKSLTLAAGASARLSAQGFTAAGTAVKATWASSNTKVASVTKSGTITAKKAGKAKLTVTAGGKRASVVLTVVKAGTKKVKAATVKAAGVKTSMKVGDVVWLTASYTPAKAQGVKVKLTSSAPAVVSVTKTGRVVAKSPGKAVLTLTAGHAKKKHTITVSAPKE
jgi:hypothetical protein